MPTILICPEPAQGIPFMDGGTIRLTHPVGHSHAFDLALSGRGVSDDEAHHIGLANRIVARGEALTAALNLARGIASFPRAAVRNDRLSSYEQWALNLDEALLSEYRHGMATLNTGELLDGHDRNAAGEWRR